MRSEGQVADLGNASVVICGRCISRIRSVDPGRKVSGSRVVIDEELSATFPFSSLMTEGSSSHLTAFRCFSLTESKHTGQRTHLFSAVPRRWRIHGKQNTYVDRETREMGLSVFDYIHVRISSSSVQWAEQGKSDT